MSGVRGDEVAKASPRGIHLVIAEALRKEIKKGEPLLLEAALMRTHNASRNTIRRALRVLEDDGVVDISPTRSMRLLSPLLGTRGGHSRWSPRSFRGWCRC
ncbi:GntR family transcriptional regulator [Streptomyces sp. NPDC088923]|uniref:GntR family transcriptional regulator n=1 Tax=Streptomyces sp. NPDC088923 TaxID=3365913 RepID=UPI003807ADD8